MLLCEEKNAAYEEKNAAYEEKNATLGGEKNATLGREKCCLMKIAHPTPPSWAWQHKIGGTTYLK